MNAFVRVVHGLVGAGHKTRDRSGQEDAALASGAHLAPDELHEIDGAGDVGIDDVPNIGKVLVEKRATKAVARIREQGIHGTAIRRRPEFVDTS